MQEFAGVASLKLGKNYSHRNFQYSLNFIASARMFVRKTRAQKSYLFTTHRPEIYDLRYGSESMQLYRSCTTHSPTHVHGAHLSIIPRQQSSVQEEAGRGTEPPPPSLTGSPGAPAACWPAEGSLERPSSLPPETPLSPASGELVGSPTAPLLVRG